MDDKDIYSTVYNGALWGQSYDVDFSKITGSMTVSCSTGTGSILGGAMGASNPYNYGTVTVPNTHQPGQFLYSTGSNPAWTAPNITTTGVGLHVAADAEFEGDIKWKGRNLGTLLEKIEDRLAILAEPNPAKLEKFAALKKAYDNYKLLEKLIGEE